MKKFLSFAFLIMLITFFSCENRKAEIVYPASTCDTSNVRFSVEIKAILQANCYSCHASSVANSFGGGYKYDTYIGILPNVMNGKMLNSIMQVPGSDPMPKGAPKISDCDIAKFRTWIRNGYPNN